MNKKFQRDYESQSGKQYSWGGVLIRLLKNRHLRYIFYGRIVESSNNAIVKVVCRFLQKCIRKNSGIEISFDKATIGAGLNLIHPFSITVNDNAVLGENVVLFKGSTIGSIRSGKRSGTPIIGNRVVVACNAMVCGGVHIGNDVLIAANSFVDFDVPDNSIVIGNPGMVVHKDNPTRDYIKEVGK